MRRAGGRGHLANALFPAQQSQIAHIMRQEAGVCAPGARMRLAPNHDAVAAHHMRRVLHDCLHVLLDAKKRQTGYTQSRLHQKIGEEIK